MLETRLRDIARGRRSRFSGRLRCGDGAGDGCWLVGEKLKALRAAILWNDGRAWDYVEHWLAEGKLAQAYAINGTVGFAGLANAVLIWLGKHQPRTLDRARHILTCCSRIFYNLMHKVLADVGDTSAPFLDTAAKGSLWNFSLDHRAADMARAAVEGLTIVIRDCMSAVPGNRTTLHLSGGGSNSDGWCQLLADVTGLQTRRVGVSEATAKGAAIAGLIAKGRASPEDALAKWRDESGHWQPDPQRAAYNRRYQEFCRRSGRPNLAKKLH